MYPRYARKRVESAMARSRVTLVTGPRQAGKTTLVQSIAGQEMPYLTMDSESLRREATLGPEKFLEGLDRAVIDEVQRVPDLLLEIKRQVDLDPRWGRFLLTGSANLLMLPQVADSLAGRMSLAQLLPLSQAEIRGGQGTFLEAAFQGLIPETSDTATGADLVDLVLAGGYPEALKMGRWDAQRDWYLDYVDTVIHREVPYTAQVAQFDQLLHLARVLAEHSGQLVNCTRIGSALGMNHVTTLRYLRILESVYLARRLPPWYSNKLKRLTKTPKLHFLDSGLLSAVRGIGPAVVARDRSEFGSLLETFVVSELLKIASWSGERYQFFQLRDKEKREVDVVIEDARRRVVGIEVKASSRVGVDEISGLRRLKEVCGDKFVRGFVLYDGVKVEAMRDGMTALPMSSLWS